MVSTGSSGAPRSGYYPDPSIPGYIRYWDGLSWVPGTSRPEPVEGEPFPEPPRRATGGSRYPASPTVGGTGDVQAAGSSPGSPETPEWSEPAHVDDPPAVPGELPGRADALPEPRIGGEMLPHEPVTDWDDPRRIHGNRPQAAGGWQSSAAWDTGGSDTGGSLTDDAPADPRGGSWGRTDQNAQAQHGDPLRASAHGETTDLSWQPHLSPDARGGQDQQGLQEAQDQQGLPPGSPNTVGFRLPQVPGGASTTDHIADGGGYPASAHSTEAAGVPAPNADQTVGFRMPGQARRSASPTEDPAGPGQPDHTVGLRRSEVLDGGTQQLRGPAADSGTQQLRGPGARASTSDAPQHGGDRFEQSGLARPPWEQQVQGLAAQEEGGPEAVTPWRPPVSDPFLLAAQQQERPAGLGRRLAARLVDVVIVFGLTGAVAFPFAGKAMDHVQEQIDAAELAGETRQVWLVDGTTGGYLALVLGVFLLAGLLYEALPTARWGRTLGKRLFGVRVLDIERQDAVRTSAAVVRWLAFSVLALLVIGVVNVMWCLFDRPWRQCWHDKLARTFLAAD